jgi:hypothetical protein
MPPRSQSLPCPLARHARERALEEFVIDHVEDESQHDRTPPFEWAKARLPLFPDHFAAGRKWFQMVGVKEAAN